MKEKLARIVHLSCGQGRRRVCVILFLHILIGVCWDRVHEKACDHHYFGLPQLCFAWLYGKGAGRRFLTPTEEREMFAL